MLSGALFLDFKGFAYFDLHSMQTQWVCYQVHQTDHLPRAEKSEQQLRSFIF